MWRFESFALCFLGYSKNWYLNLKILPSLHSCHWYHWAPGIPSLERLLRLDGLMISPGIARPRMFKSFLIRFHVIVVSLVTFMKVIELLRLYSSPAIARCLGFCKDVRQQRKEEGEVKDNAPKQTPYIRTRCVFPALFASTTKAWCGFIGSRRTTFDSSLWRRRSFWTDHIFAEAWLITSRSTAGSWKPAMAMEA